jgi:hypothetical protein
MGVRFLTAKTTRCCKIALRRGMAEGASRINRALEKVPGYVEGLGKARLERRKMRWGCG